MNLLLMVLYVISAVPLILIGMYLGFLLTRHTAFKKMLEPAIEKSFASGYNTGFKHGKKDVEERIDELLSSTQLITLPLTEGDILQFMRAAIADLDEEDEEPQE